MYHTILNIDLHILNLNIFNKNLFLKFSTKKILILAPSLFF